MTEKNTTMSGRPFTHVAFANTKYHNRERGEGWGTESEYDFPLNIHDEIRTES